MSEDQHSRLESKLDTVLSALQILQVDIARQSASFEERIKSLESSRDTQMKIIIGVLVAVIGGLLLLLVKGGVRV